MAKKKILEKKVEPRPFSFIQLFLLIPLFLIAIGDTIRLVVGTIFFLWNITYKNIRLPHIPTKKKKPKIIKPEGSTPLRNGLPVENNSQPKTQTQPQTPPEVVEQPSIDIVPEVKPKVDNPNLAIAMGMNMIDAIAPQTLDEDFDYVKINDIYFRTVFVGGYPRFVAPGWLEPLVNLDTSFDCRCRRLAVFF